MVEIIGRNLPQDLMGREAEYAQMTDVLSEENTTAQVLQGRARGMGLAAVVLGMWQGLEDSGLTRAEKLALIQAALKG